MFVIKVLWILEKFVAPFFIEKSATTVFQLFSSSRSNFNTRWYSGLARYAGLTQAAAVALESPIFFYVWRDSAM